MAHHFRKRNLNGHAIHKPNLTGDALQVRVAELLFHDIRFGEDSRKRTKSYQEMREFMSQSEVILSQHPFHQIVRNRSNALLAIEIQKRKLSISVTASLPLGDTSKFSSEFPELVARNATMRLKDAEYSFSIPRSSLIRLQIPTTEWAETTGSKTNNCCSFLHNLPSKHALRFYTTFDVPNATTFQQASEIVGY